MFKNGFGWRDLPSVGILDSQTVKTVSLSAENAGFDGAKKIKGRKRHIMIDIFGLLPAVVVHSPTSKIETAQKYFLRGF